MFPKANQAVVNTLLRAGEDPFVVPRLAGESMIGKSIWKFESHRRVYAKDKSGSPIWREHWVEWKVTDESPRLWIVGHHGKVPKKGPLPDGWAWSQAEIDKLEWKHDHQWKIVNLAQKLSPAVLDQLAGLVGYPVRMPK